MKNVTTAKNTFYLIALAALLGACRNSQHQNETPKSDAPDASADTVLVIGVWNNPSCYGMNPSTKTIRYVNRNGVEGDFFIKSKRRCDEFDNEANFVEFGQEIIISGNGVFIKNLTAERMIHEYTTKHK